jgi:hypothetical protein
LDSFVNNLAIFVGWLVAITIVWIQLGKTRQDNADIKRDEIRKSLEIDGFKEINVGARKLSDAISEIVIKLLTLPGKLKLHREQPSIFGFDKNRVILDVNGYNIRLSDGSSSFVLAIEGHEIVVTAYDHLRRYIQLRLDDVREAIDDFRSYLISTDIATMKTDEGFAQFKSRCEQIRDDLYSIQSYLFDYRIELMNSLLSDIFKSKVPQRKPLDPKYRILTEIATKEGVAKELEERQSKYIR